MEVVYEMTKKKIIKWRKRKSSVCLSQGAINTLPVRPTKKPHTIVYKRVRVYVFKHTNRFVYKWYSYISIWIFQTFKMLENNRFYLSFLAYDFRLLLLSFQWHWFSLKKDWNFTSSKKEKQIANERNALKKKRLWNRDTVVYIHRIRFLFTDFYPMIALKGKNH